MNSRLFRVAMIPLAVVLVLNPPLLLVLAFGVFGIWFVARLVRAVVRGILRTWI